MSGLLAPAVAAGAAVAVLGFAGKIMSAEGGFDIPAGVNPLTQLHAREMVLPASLADQVRAMSGSPATAPPINITIQAVDAGSVRKLLLREGGAIADALKTQLRGFKG